MSKRTCGNCEWLIFFEGVCSNKESPYFQNDVSYGFGCRYFELMKSCPTCKHHLGDWLCDISLEHECRDGKFEAWEAAEK